MALSLDSLTVGGRGRVGSDAGFRGGAALFFVLGLAAILLGRWLGDKLMRGLQIEVSWISGLMLLVLAGPKAGVSQRVQIVWEGLYMNEIDQKFEALAAEIRGLSEKEIYYRIRKHF